jgi:hypothetical protein
VVEPTLTTQDPVRQEGGAHGGRRVLVIRYDSRIDRAITAVIHPPPRTITWLVTVVYQAGSFGVVIDGYDLTFPPIWGWATLVWMRKREYL